MRSHHFGPAALPLDYSKVAPPTKEKSISIVCCVTNRNFSPFSPAGFFRKPKTLILLTLVRAFYCLFPFTRTSLKKKSIIVKQKEDERLHDKTGKCAVFPLVNSIHAVMVS
jgi:hypothetical protein